MEYTSIHILYLFSQNYSNLLFNGWCYGTSIIYLNVYIYIYLLYLFFSLIFLYDFKKLKNLTGLKIFNKHNFSCITLILILLSLSGIPPLLGFVGKFLLFLFLFFSQKYIFIIILSLLNIFSIYFYIQNLRFLISKSQVNFFLKSGFYVFFNKSLINIIVFFNFFNFFGIFFSEDFFFYFYMVVSYKGF